MPFTFSTLSVEGLILLSLSTAWAWSSKIKNHLRTFSEPT